MTSPYSEYFLIAFIVLLSLQWVESRELNLESLDDQLLADAIQAEREKDREIIKASFRPKKIGRRGAIGRKLENEVRDSEFSRSSLSGADDDYNDFEQTQLKGDEDHGLSQIGLEQEVTKDPLSNTDSSGDSDSMAPKAKAKMNNHLSVSTPNPIPLYEIPPPKIGFYFQHYPWWLLPRQYRLRAKDFGYVYPPQYQRAKYYWPGRLPNNYDPYAIYYQTKQWRDQYYSNPDNQNREYGNSLPNHGFGEELGENGNNSGEVELSKKKDPLDDLSLETLEKIDRLGEDGLVDEDETDDFSKKKRGAPKARALTSRA